MHFSPGNSLALTPSIGDVFDLQSFFAVKKIMHPDNVFNANRYFASLFFLCIFRVYMGSLLILYLKLTDNGKYFTDVRIRVINADIDSLNKQINM